MRDYLEIFKDCLVATNRQLVDEIIQDQEKETQESWEGFEFRPTDCDICDNTQDEAE